MATTTPTRRARTKKPRKTTARKAAPARKSRAVTKKAMTDAHKKALATGREQGRAVDAYLETVRHAPRRGPRRTPEKLNEQIMHLSETIAGATGATKLRLVQRRLDLESERDALLAQADDGKILAGFVKHAAAYGARKGISFSAWRECGVPVGVLRDAGITRNGTT